MGAKKTKVMKDNPLIMKDIATLLKQLKTKAVKEDFYLYSQKKALLYRLYAELEMHEEAMKVAKEFIKECKPSLIAKEGPNEQITLFNIVKEAYFYLGSRGQFHYFLIGMEMDRPPEERFYQPRMKQLKVAVDDFQDLFDRKITFYELMMPPRVGKTTLGLLFLAMCIGCHPNKSSITVSYAGFVASTFFDGVKSFIEDERYNYKKIFPNSQIVDSDTKNMTLDLRNPQRYKSITFRSIDGQLTGALEATDIMYFDDLIQNIEEAKNMDRLDKAWDKVRTDLFQRMKENEGCVLCAIGTNWSKYDPLSRLYDLKGTKSGGRVRILPALDPITDESNFDFDYGLGFTTAYYRNLRDEVYKDDPVTFQCVYQQERMERTEVNFAKDKLLRYAKLPGGKPDKVVAWCDCAFGGGDFLSMPIAYVYDGVQYIVDWVYNDGAYNITEPKVINKLLEHKVEEVVFEANNGGEFYAKDIRELLKKRKGKTKVFHRKASTAVSKEERIEQYTPDILGMCFKMDEDVVPHSDYNHALNDLCRYSSKTVAKNKRDDAPDSLAGLASMNKTTRKARVSTYNRADMPYL